MANPEGKRDGKDQLEPAKGPRRQAQQDNPSRTEADQARADQAAAEELEADRFQATDN